jgi:uncharacterized protein
VRVVVAGASGFLGTALRRALADRGDDVVRLVRGPVESAAESRWDPTRAEVDDGVIAAADVVVCLSGANLFRPPWTSAYKQTLRSSRVGPVATLARSVARAVAGADGNPAFLAGSAIGYYGPDRGDAMLDETSPPGSGFVSELVQDWERAAHPAEKAGARVCYLRSGIVLDRSGGALPLMRLPFWLGLGGRIGSGRQYFSVVSLADWVGAVMFLATEASSAGPYAVTAPAPPTNAEFTRELAAELRRPAILRVPAAPLRLLLREAAGELLGSLRVIPRRLEEAGFGFRDRDVAAVLARGLSR